MVSAIMCKKCGTELDDSYNKKMNEPCPKCGSTKQDITIIENDRLEMHDYIRGKIKDPNLPSREKTRQDFFQGDDRRKKDGKWMTKERSIDKDNDIYKETVVDPETGKIIHSCEEPLSKHRGHGSAKKK